MADSTFLRDLWRKGGPALERWTNGHLDRQPPQDIASAQTLLARIDQELDQMNDPPEALREVVAQQRDQFIRLRVKKDFQARVLEWAKQGLEIVGLAERAEPKRGRPKGSTPGLAAADADAIRIRRLWRTTFKASPRAMARQSPNAIEIAARRHGVTFDQLENYRKNRGKPRR